mmetsp:Transcript_11649/g.15837  ORF Transcript_11649/g.15837 Transcript_11649/m.15837 type:complete len:85 (-) Transcript_11649:141-395(-)|eukprot:CAMPEP_0196580514 /NCGR_PEP_ID=MMETSP1081-20130531/28950_1 /TAXON_ID=36882 /ORGANISM="Pyramimonas amylifera, Strain CCMP720" /LENGTH=84 /DNA_ID=CAMNT_0041900395 /DNA_START=208 /DNA_END=462 /DNA_ORIENTATION=+
MSLTASFQFPGAALKTFDVEARSSPLSASILEMKLICNDFLKEYLKSVNIDVADAEKDDVFEEKMSDDEDDNKHSKSKKRKVKK